MDNQHDFAGKDEPLPVGTDLGSLASGAYLMGGADPVFDICQTHTTYLSFMDRIRVLFGKPIVLHVENKIDRSGYIWKTTTHTYVTHLFPKKSTVGCIEMKQTDIMEEKGAD